MCSLSEQSDSPLDDVEQVLLGEQPRYRKADVAEAVGMDQARTERLWQAMGFAHVEESAAVFTDSDIDALRSMMQLVSADVITSEVETAAVRSVARMMSRMAEWHVGIFRSVLGPRFADDPATTAQFAEALVPVIERLQGYVWRRHLAAAMLRELDGPDPGVEERTRIVGFADLVGYTRLVRNFTEIELAGLIDEFEDLATAVIAENHGRIVKTVGDEVLFVADATSHAAEIALTLNEQVAEAIRLPPLRIGVAQGPVLSRFGDVYGSTVNIASRLTSVARPASVLVDRELAAALGDRTEYALTPVGPRKVQGFPGLRAWALRRTPDRGL
jgi:adenylate cyclase